MDNKRFNNRTKSQNKYAGGNHDGQIRNYENIRKGGFDSIFDDFGFGRINEIEKRFFGNDNDDIFGSGPGFGMGKRFGSIFEE
jgi:hypothetical protein